MKRGLILCCGLIFVLALVSLSFAGEDEVVKSILESRASVKPFPLPSAQIPDLNLEKGYALQKKLTAALLAKGEKVGGFKAGLTSKEAQQRFGSDQPLLGPFFASGRVEPGAVIDPKDFVRLFLETEIAYIAGEKISAPVKDIASLKKMIKEVAPAIELPDMRFADMKNLKPGDIVADAVASAKYLVGKPVAPDKVDVNEIKVTLTLDGSVVNEGQAKDALGDQWEALLWLVNGVVKHGGAIEPGQVLYTGALGKMIPGKPGKYEAVYGPLGTITFTVK
ncbi:MAG: 4-oxalocrotonate decarboxylase [Deltaproteobacteria bacterium]|nr:4-oxalocrotonate decarboxylase [Deltaproteobacteria bacterium]